MLAPSRADGRPAAPAQLALAVVAVAWITACGGGGGGGGGTPTSPPVPEVRSVSGTTTSNAAGGCSADSHDFLVAAGSSVQVTLNQSGDTDGLMVQLCAGGIDNNDCTINQQRIAVGASLAGVRKGGESQNLKFLRLGCTVGPLVPGPTSYTATVTFQRP